MDFGAVYWQRLGLDGLRTRAPGPVGPLRARLASFRHRPCLLLRCFPFVITNQQLACSLAVGRADKSADMLALAPNVIAWSARGELARLDGIFLYG